MLGVLHLGTALNKILKDIVVRWQTLDGKDAPYVPGWDCHGMPIEHQVVRQAGESLSRSSKAEIRHRCREFARKYLDIQRTEFRRLGVLGDWDRSYLTMDYAYEADILASLRTMSAS